MNNKFQPLLAVKVDDIEALPYPVMVSPKIDGIRCCILTADTGDVLAVTRKLKAIPNTYIREVLSDSAFLNLDGEIITYTDDIADDFNTIQSKVMSKDGTPDFAFWVFDRFARPDQPFAERIAQAEQQLECNDVVNILHHIEIADARALREYEQAMLKAGAEGVMIRDPQGRYKYGRSTVNEAILLKMIRRDRAEAVVVGVEEEMANHNTAELDERGYTKRSTRKEGRVGKGVLGKFVCEWVHDRSVRFEVGTGFTAEQREVFFDESYMGVEITVEYRGLGPNGRPRFPTFVGFRPEMGV